MNEKKKLKSDFLLYRVNYFSEFSYLKGGFAILYPLNTTPMTKQEPIGRPLLKTPNQIIQRLERNNRELIHLRETLRSYVCEPKTYKLFERFEILKRSLELLQRKNLEVIHSLEGRKKCMDEQWDKCRQHLQEYHELEMNVLEYIGMAKMHG